jgi:hypothetical protein
MNKFEIIETADYTLAVSDEEIKESDWVYKIEHSHTSCFYVNSEELADDYNRNSDNYKKIIAYQPKNNAAELDLPLLPQMIVEDEVEVKSKYKEAKLYKDWTKVSRFLACGLQGVEVRKIVVEDDVEKLADLFSTDETKVHPADSYIAKQGFIEGYNKCLENLNKAASKIYTEEDLRKSVKFFESYIANTGRNIYDKDISFYLNSLKQPKWFIAEFNERCKCGTSCEYEVCIHESKLKTTTISGKTYLVGKYE